MPVLLTLSSPPQFHAPHSSTPHPPQQPLSQVPDAIYPAGSTSPSRRHPTFVLRGLPESKRLAVTSRFICQQYDVAIPDPSKRLRAGGVWCFCCTVIEPSAAGFLAFYEAKRVCRGTTSPCGLPPTRVLSPTRFPTGASSVHLLAAAGQMVVPSQVPYNNIYHYPAIWLVDSCREGSRVALSPNILSWPSGLIVFVSA